MSNQRKSTVTYLEAFHSEVTGSCFLLTIVWSNGKKSHLLVDCGMFQETQYLRLNYRNEINAKIIDAVLITHNHIDHTGNLPKLVHNGYQGPIYMTTYTKDLIPAFLEDSAAQLPENLSAIKRDFPRENFKLPYSLNDVSSTLNLITSMPFNQTVEILPDVKVTFLPNGHLLGSALILVQIQEYGCEDINYLFTGDYKPSNLFFNVADIPDWILNLDLNVVTEATYGTTSKSQKTICFNDNIKEAVSKKQNILIGVFAQGRMQEILYRIKNLQEEGIIPNNYEIILDGPLGIETTFIYKRLIYSDIHCFDSFFEDVAILPYNIKIMNKKERKLIFNTQSPKIVVTTSGMLSHGPAVTYLPMFLARENSLIHLTGYAAEDTIARKLLEHTSSKIEIDSEECSTEIATLKTTNEFSSHATLDELLEFLGKFHNLRSVIINHGQTDVKLEFKESVIEHIDCKKVEIIDRSKVFIIGHYGISKFINSKKDSDFNAVVKLPKIKSECCPNRRRKINCKI